MKVECLRSLTKAEVISFYEEYLVQGSTGRRKLACHVISALEGGPDGDQQLNQQQDQDTVQLVEDITTFKCSLPLFPLPRPFVALETLKRTNDQPQKEEEPEALIGAIP